MTGKEIKLECESLRDKIVLSKIRIQELQAQCKHENTHEGKWSYRVGSYTDAIICSDCMKKVKDLIDDYLTNNHEGVSDKLEEIFWEKSN